MIKVIIVDDEMLVRIGIQSLISWNEHGFEIVGDAEDGEEALQLIERTMPDIVLTDIVMPGMDGLTLIEHIKQRYPHIRVCVLSSYSEYDYVRRAMKLGADDYFLKASMKPDELLRLLGEMKQKMQDRDGSDVTTAPYEPIDLIEKDTLPEGLQELIDACPCRVLYIRSHRYNQRNRRKEPVQKSLLRLLQQEQHDADVRSIWAYKEDSWLMVLPAEDVQEKARDLIVATKRFLDVTISIGCSDPISDIAELENAIVEAEQAWENSFYEGKGKVYLYDRQIDSEDDQSTHSTLEQLLEQLDQIGDNQIDSHVNQIFRCLADWKAPIARNIEVFLEIWECIKRFLKRRGIDSDFGKRYQFGIPVYQRIMQIETLAEAKEFFDLLLGSYHDCVQHWKSERYSEDIKKLLDYLHEHYREQISLKDAADYINLSESYLSYLFKKETQKSVIEYVTELRINEAAALLRDTDLPNYIIAERVGYQNINYFGRIFKKWKGVSPSIYRERFRQ